MSLQALSKSLPLLSIRNSRLASRLVRYRLVVPRFSSRVILGSENFLAAAVPSTSCSVTMQRWFSNGKTNDSDEEPKGPPIDDIELKNDPANAAPPADLFGLNLEDELEDNANNSGNPSGAALGPPSRWPPQYKRDAATGRLLTEQVEEELSERDRRVLQADTLERDELTWRNVERHWRRRQQQAEKVQQERGGNPGRGDLLDDLGSRVRETDMSLNVLGRSVEAQRTEEVLDDGSKLGRDDSGFSQHLTPSEFATFRAFMKQSYDVPVDKEDIPVQEASARSRKAAKDSPDDIDRSLQWLTLRAQRQMDDLAADDNPYSDLNPGDLSPTRLVNRRRAKPIPRELLHHNNVELLRYFLTPTGQIRNRVQTRLGAKDQRKVAKLIKRARALGLIPHMGQFKVEQHGWVHAQDIDQERSWEEELVRRGLVIARKDPASRDESSSAASKN